MLFFFDFLFRWAVACKFKQNMGWFVIDLFAEAKMENPSDSCRKVYFSQPLDSLFHLFSLERVIWDITRSKRYVLSKRMAAREFTYMIN